jgi:hypothetical protein
MKCIIESARHYELKSLVDEYARAILEAGFTLERFDEDNDAKILIELSSMEDLKKLTDAVECSIVFDPQRFRDDIYPTIIIYDDDIE